MHKSTAPASPLVLSVAYGIAVASAAVEADTNVPVSFNRRKLELAANDVYRSRMVMEK